MSRLDELAALSGLALEALPLRGLAGWEPVGSLLEALARAASEEGEDGLSASEVARLRAWARRWGALTADLRHLYEAEVRAGDLGVVEAGLWGILTGRGQDSLTGSQVWAIRARFEAREGRSPTLIAPALR